MKLKSSNRFSILFISILAIIASGIWYLQTNAKKEPKYPKSPITQQVTTLDFIQIIVNEKSFKKLKKKRDKAVSVGILETQDSDYVPATVSFNGKDFDAEVRLKGDWTIHLEGDKWSFRVKLKNDKTILGMRKFSLHHPNTRRYLNEWLYHRAMKSEDLMGLRYGFVEGKIHIKSLHNGYITKDVGMYAIEETFDKRAIENNKRKESVILKFSEDYWWNEVKKSKAIADKFGLNYNDFMNYDLISKVKYPILPFSESKVLEDSTLHNYFKISKNLLEDLRSNRINISDAFDIEKLAMDTALMNLFGAIHGTFAINVRYYFNPITSKLEPISFDGNSGVKLEKFRHFVYAGKTVDTLYFKALAKALSKVALPSYVDNLLKTNKKEIDAYTNTLKTEFKGRLLNPENLRYNQNIMRTEFEKLKKDFNLDIIFEMEQRSHVEKFHDLSNSNNWSQKEVELIASNLKYKGKTSQKIKRSNTKTAGFIRYGNIKIGYGTSNEISVIVKKDSGNAIFGMRMQGIYPNRVDALFDLDTGKLIETFKDGGFYDEKASIKPLGNGWYLCTLIARANIDQVNVIFGPSYTNKKASNWEGPTKIKSSILVIPESLELKEY